jgi:hypothetical protein
VTSKYENSSCGGGSMIETLKYMKEEGLLMSKEYEKYDPKNKELLKCDQKMNKARYS